MNPSPARVQLAAGALDARNALILSTRSMIHFAVRSVRSAAAQGTGRTHAAESAQCTLIALSALGGLRLSLTGGGPRWAGDWRTWASTLCSSAGRRSALYLQTHFTSDAHAMTSGNHRTVQTNALRVTGSSSRALFSAGNVGSHLSRSANSKGARVRKKRASMFLRLTAVCSAGHNNPSPAPLLRSAAAPWFAALPPAD